MDDLIRRQAAIDEAKEWIDAVYFEENDKRERKAIECFIGSLKNMPSAQPERKMGKWVQNFDGNEWYWFCSNCKEEWYEEDLWMGGNDFPNYCPNCGADMRGDKHETN